MFSTNKPKRYFLSRWLHYTVKHLISPADPLLAQVNFMCPQNKPQSCAQWSSLCRTSDWSWDGIMMYFLWFQRPPDELDTMETSYAALKVRSLCYCFRLWVRGNFRGKVFIQTRRLGTIIGVLPENDSVCNFLFTKSPYPGIFWITKLLYHQELSTSFLCRCSFCLGYICVATW